MAVLKHPENFVSYRADLDPATIVGELRRLDAAFETASSAAEKSDLLTRQRLLELQRIVSAGDAHFEKRQYLAALASYQRAAQLALALISPAIGKRRRPSIFVDSSAIQERLIEVSAGLLANLRPDPPEPPLIALTAPLTLPPAAFGIPNSTRLEFGDTLPTDVLEIADHATAAVQQGKWDRADAGFTAAFERVSGDTPGANRARAALLMNAGVVKVQRGDTQGAVEAIGRARTLFRRAEDALGEAQTVHNLGYAHARAGNRDEALRNLSAARRLAGDLSFRSVLHAGPPEGVVHPAEPMTSGRIAAADATRAVVPVRASDRPNIELFLPELGSEDFQITLRDVRHGVTLLPLETPVQQAHEATPRQLHVAAGDEITSIVWTGNAGPKAQELRQKVFDPHRAAHDALHVGYRVATVADLAARLPQLYHVVLPIKMGDCHRRLGEFGPAEVQYIRAASAEAFLNVPVEAPDLWRRLADNALAWADSLYREERTQEALPIYGRLITDTDTAPTSFLYTQPTLSPTGSLVKSWLAAITAGTPLPELNPAFVTTLQQVRLRWTYIRAGLDFFGRPAHMVPPFTFKYLQEIARYFASQAIQAEQRYIDFLDRYENEQLTSLQLDQAQQVAAKEIDAARERENEARALQAAAEAATALAATRTANAEAMRDLFDSTAWEAAALAGMIARGNAWTGQDLPNLNYTIDGTPYSGSKHEVLQSMTRRQTEISQDLQRQQMENAISELTAAQAVAVEQQNAADARLAGAQIGTALAEMRERHAQEMLDAFNSQFFDPEQWLSMAYFMRGIATTALDRAIDIARLMQRAYNFEQMESVAVIRSSYVPNSTQGLLGAAWLLSDIESFTHRIITTVHDKPVPVKWPISMAERYPGQFLLFKQGGRMEFETSIQELALSFPGTYRHQLVAVEAEFEGFVPPEGVHGRLTSSGLSRYRDKTGNVRARVQPAETLVLSRFARRQDGLLLAPRAEMRGLFEGAGAASGWTIEVPPSANDLDLRNIFDIRLVLYFECLFSKALFDQDAHPPDTLHLERTRALHLRFATPDAFFTLHETGSALVALDARDFPFNQRSPIITSLAVLAVSVAGKTLEGTTISIGHPGVGAPTSVVFDANNTVARSALPITGTPSAYGTYTFTLEAAQQSRRAFLADLILVMDYTFTAPA